MSYATYEEDYKNQEEVERIRKNMIALENANKKNDENKNPTTTIAANLRITQRQYEYVITYITICFTVKNNEDIIPVIIQELKNNNRYKSVIREEIEFESFRIVSKS